MWSLACHARESEGIVTPISRQILAMKTIFHAGEFRNINTLAERILFDCMKKWGFSSFGRAIALQAIGERFESANLHQN